MNTTYGRLWLCGQYEPVYARPKPKKTIEQQVAEKRRTLELAVEKKRDELAEAEKELKEFNATLSKLLK